MKKLCFLREQLNFLILINQRAKLIQKISQATKKQNIVKNQKITIVSKKKRLANK